MFCFCVFPDQWPDASAQIVDRQKQTAPGTRVPAQGSPAAHHPCSLDSFEAQWSRWLGKECLFGGPCAFTFCISRPVLGCLRQSADSRSAKADGLCDQSSARDSCAADTPLAGCTLDSCDAWQSVQHWSVARGWPNLFACSVS